MTRPSSTAFLLAVLLISASTASAAPLRMFIETEDGSVQTANVSAAEARGMTIALPDGHGSMLLPMERIKSWRLAPPKSWSDAQSAIASGQPKMAIAPMREFVFALLPLLNLPKGDAAAYLFTFADLLRSQGDYKGALALLDKVLPDATGETRAQLIVVAAYCRAMLGEADAAETQLNLLRAPSRRSGLFTLYKLTRARIASARKDFVSTLDEIASVIACKRLGSDSYAEALYLSADAYDQLGEAILKQKNAIASDDKIRRLYEQNHGEAFDALGMINSDKSSVSAIMDAPPNLPGASIEIRKELVRVFPNSPWTVLARAKLPPGAFDNVATHQPENAKSEPPPAGNKPIETNNSTPEPGKLPANSP